MIGVTVCRVSLIWVEGKDGRGGEAVHRLAAEVLANAIALASEGVPSIHKSVLVSQ